MLVTSSPDTEAHSCLEGPLSCLPTHGLSPRVAAPGQAATWAVASGRRGRKAGGNLSLKELKSNSLQWNQPVLS